MSTSICRAQRQTFCRFHGFVHMDIEPETHDGLITIALSLSGKPNGYQFGQDTGLNLGALTPAGTLTDEAILALSQKYGAHIYGAESDVARLGQDQIFNLAGLRRDVRAVQHQLDIDTWLQGTTPELQRQHAVNQALNLWTSDASHRISQLAKTIPSNPATPPMLPAQSAFPKRRYTQAAHVYTHVNKAFRSWFPQAMAA